MAKGFGKPKDHDPFKHFPIEISIDTYIDFVKLNWELLAAFAWHGFLSEGKGLLIINVDKATEGAFGLTPNMKWMMGNTPAFYLGEQNPLFHTHMNSQWPDTLTAQKIANYDPTQKFIAAFLWSEDLGATVQGFSHPLPHMLPPACHQRLQHRLDFLRESFFAT